MVATENWIIVLASINFAAILVYLFLVVKGWVIHPFAKNTGYESVSTQDDIGIDKTTKEIVKLNQTQLTPYTIVMAAMYIVTYGWFLFSAIWGAKFTDQWFDHIIFWYGGFTGFTVAGVACFAVRWAPLTNFCKVGALGSLMGAYFLLTVQYFTPAEHFTKVFIYNSPFSVGIGALSFMLFVGILADLEIPFHKQKYGILYFSFVMWAISMVTVRIYNDFVIPFVWAVALATLIPRNLGDFGATAACVVGILGLVGISLFRGAWIYGIFV